MWIFGFCFLHNPMAFPLMCHTHHTWTPTAGPTLFPVLGTFYSLSPLPQASLITSSFKPQHHYTSIIPPFSCWLMSLSSLLESEMLVSGLSLSLGFVLWSPVTNARNHSSKSKYITILEGGSLLPCVVAITKSGLLALTQDNRQFIS